MSANRTNTRRMHRLRKEFFDEGRRLDAAGDPSANCWIDGERINYAATPGTTPDSHELDHYYSVANYPELQEDPSNFRHAHKLCNGTRGADGQTYDLGEQVPDWWG